MTAPRPDVRLRPVARADVHPLVKMTVAPGQEGFVAPNANSLAEQPYETGAYPFVIEAGGEPAGFLMVIDCREHDYLDEGDDPEAAFLWRFMVAREHQGRGVGRAALMALMDWCRARGLSRLVTSAVEANAPAQALYEGVGLGRTGRVWDGEVEFAGPVPPGRPDP